jgi:predicted Holliday junction resolvase-like endonuclease
MTKSEVSKEFARLRVFGFCVWNFNSNKAMKFGMVKDFVDHVITDGKYIVFVEIKIGADKLSEGQKKTSIALSSASVWNKNLHYKLLTDMKAVKKLVDDLLIGRL